MVDTDDTQRTMDKTSNFLPYMQQGSLIVKLAWKQFIDMRRLIKTRVNIWKQIFKQLWPLIVDNNTHDAWKQFVILLIYIYIYLKFKTDSDSSVNSKLDC